MDEQIMIDIIKAFLVIENIIFIFVILKIQNYVKLIQYY